MTSILRSPVQGRPVWTGAGMAGRSDWVHHLMGANFGLEPGTGL